MRPSLGRRCECLLSGLGVGKEAVEGYVVQALVEVTRRARPSPAQGSCRPRRACPWMRPRSRHPGVVGAFVAQGERLHERR